MRAGGQVAVPADVREALGPRPGEPVEFARNEAGEAIIGRPEADEWRRRYDEELIRFDAVAEGWKHLPLVDVPIGGQAVALGAALMTRDRQRFAPYSPDLALITPESHP